MRRIIMLTAILLTIMSFNLVDTEVAEATDTWAYPMLNNGEWLTYEIPSGYKLIAIDPNSWSRGSFLNVRVGAVEYQAYESHSGTQPTPAFTSGYTYWVVNHMGSIELNYWDPDLSTGCPQANMVGLLLRPYIAQEETVEAAKIAAQNASSYAQTAATNATNAYNAANSNYSYMTNGTYGLNAIKTQVNNAYNSASSANVNSSNVYNKANNNNIMLSSGSYGLEAIYNKTNGNNETINNETYGLQSIYNKVQEVAQNTVPIINSIKGSNGATCTTNGIFKLAIQASGTTEYRAWIDGGPDSGWKTSNIIQLTGISTGVKDINVIVRNNNGVETSGMLTIFSL